MKTKDAIETFKIPTYTIVVKHLGGDGKDTRVLHMEKASEWILSRVIEQYGNLDYLIQAFVDKEGKDEI